jgi:hypothetical protein
VISQVAHATQRLYRPMALMKTTDSFAHARPFKSNAVQEQSGAESSADVSPQRPTAAHTPAAS